MSKTNLHGPKDVRATEMQLYVNGAKNIGRHLFGI